LEEGIIIAKGLGGSSFGNEATHNKFWEGQKYKGLQEDHAPHWCFPTHMCVSVPSCWCSTLVSSCTHPRTSHALMFSRMHIRKSQHHVHCCC